MLIVDKNHTHQKANSTKSIDVHLQDKSEYINVVLPSKHIVTISASELHVFDASESDIHYYPIEVTND